MSDEEVLQAPIRRPRNRRAADAPPSHPYFYAGYELFVCVCVWVSSHKQINRQTYSCSEQLGQPQLLLPEGVAEVPYRGPPEATEAAGSAASSSRHPAEAVGPVQETKKKGWEDRGKWQWVSDVYCPQCNHHHHCDKGVRWERKANVEGEKKGKEKEVDDEDMKVEEEKNERKDSKDYKKDAKDEKEQMGWQDYGQKWSATEWQQWEEAKEEKKARELLKKSIWENTIGKIEARKLLNETERRMVLDSM